MKNALKDIVIKDFDVKSYLMQIEKIDIRINAKINQLNEIRDFASRIGSSNISAVFTSNRSISDNTAKSVIDKLDVIQDIKEDIYKYTKLKNSIIDEIYKVEDVRYMNFLLLRYVECKSLEEIAVKLKFTYPYVRRMHGIALEKFKTVYTMLHWCVILY